MEVWPGNSIPLGAVYDGRGTNFALFSSVAQKVEVCLFDGEDHETRVELPERTADVWHGYLPGVKPGQQYGFRVYGDYRPEQGVRCDANLLLLDPYARAIDDSRSIVTTPYFDWTGEQRPRTPLSDTVIYELHVKGYTKRHPDVPEHQRGTYAGLAHPSVIDHLTSIGVTAVELMPVHEHISEPHLHEVGLTNYWGYSSIGYFAAHADYASDRAHRIQEFKSMVKSLHQAGIEVILDVVYNHTGEGGNGGPTLCFRGIDNAAYYRVDPERPENYVDYTGCGNSLNARHPRVMQLIMDSLRYWVEEMHVDGFRFDLAATLAREMYDVDRLATFFQILQQDPVLQRVKLIAEPWDLGHDGYQVGNFPSYWCEWNGRFRDDVRDFWRGQQASLGAIAQRISGSADIYQPSGRRPWHSINFVTSHDGFTLRDLVSFNHKHNEANRDGGNSGEDHNRSWNCGEEGPTERTEVNALRARQQRNFMATLLLSQGVPMLLAGDELGRSQQGNNNAYCQDNELSWVDWSVVDQPLLEFTRRLSRLRADHPIFRRRAYFRGTHAAHELPDIGWYRPDGVEMTSSSWDTASTSALLVFLNGHAIGERGERGEYVRDDDFLVLLNATSATQGFVVPSALGDPPFRLVCSSGETPKKPRERRGAPRLGPGETVSVGPHEFRLYQRSR